LKAAVKTGASELPDVLYVRAAACLVFMSSVIMSRVDDVSFTTGAIWNVNCTRACFKPRDTVADGFSMRLKVHYILDPRTACLLGCIYCRRIVKYWPEALRSVLMTCRVYELVYNRRREIVIQAEELGRKLGEESLDDREQTNSVALSPQGNYTD
jgi:hypothetical protein